MTDDWALQSYEEGCKVVELSKTYKETIIKKLKHYLYELKRFRFKKMNGNSVEDLPRNKSAEEYNDIKFTDIINKMIEDDDFSPVKYMAEITRLGVEYKLSDEMIIGLLARGLRSFPSFLREADAAEHLEKMLNERGISCSVVRNPKMDVKQHTDIKVSVGDTEYYIWLFQNSATGKMHTTDRLAGNRGELPKGKHILCPMNPSNPISENVTYVKRNGWCFYSASYIENIVDCIDGVMSYKIPVYDVFMQNIDLSKEEIQIFIK